MRLLMLKGVILGCILLVYSIGVSAQDTLTGHLTLSDAVEIALSAIPRLASMTAQTEAEEGEMLPKDQVLKG